MNYPWALETMQIINNLTPDIKGKAFDPDWFLLRNRLEEAERSWQALEVLLPDSLNRPMAERIKGLMERADREAKLAVRLTAELAKLGKDFSESQLPPSP